jgi:dephospho-CoA kinase
MKPIILTFAGSIGSGKSTISRRIAATLGWKYISFGDYVRSIAKSHGLEDSRKTLQDIGQSLINEGWEPFCRSILNQVIWVPGESLVIDGIRHIEAIDTLRSIVLPTDLFLIFIELQEPVRQIRLLNRNPNNMNREDTDNHPTEIQVKTRLPQLADLIVFNDKCEDETINEIVTWLKRHK